MTNTELLHLCYALELSDKDRLNPLANYIMALDASTESINIVNELLEKFNPEKTDALMCVAILRLTFRYRDFLPSWFICRVRIREHLNYQGLDYTKLLRGLL